MRVVVPPGEGYASRLLFLPSNMRWQDLLCQKYGVQTFLIDVESSESSTNGDL